MAKGLCACCLYSLSRRTSSYEGEALLCDLPTYWIVCGEYFLFVWLSFTGERQLWSADGIHPKWWEICGGSAYSCMLHVWNSWLCNSGKLYVAAKKQSCSVFFCLYEPLSLSYPVKIKSTLKGKTGKFTPPVIAWTMIRCFLFFSFSPPPLFPCCFAFEMQHPLKQPGNKRLIYSRQWYTFGAYPSPKIIECACSTISEPSLELPLVNIKSLA